MNGNNCRFSHGQTEHAQIEQDLSLQMENFAIDQVGHDNMIGFKFQ